MRARHADLGDAEEQLPNDSLGEIIAMPKNMNTGIQRPAQELLPICTWCFNLLHRDWWKLDIDVHEHAPDGRLLAHFLTNGIHASLKGQLQIDHGLQIRLIRFAGGICLFRRAMAPLDAPSVVVQDAIVAADEAFLGLDLAAHSITPSDEAGGRDSFEPLLNVVAGDRTLVAIDGSCSEGPCIYKVEMGSFLHPTSVQRLEAPRARTRAKEALRLSSAQNPLPSGPADSTASIAAPVKQGGDKEHRQGEQQGPLTTPFVVP